MNVDLQVSVQAADVLERFRSLPEQIQIGVQNGLQRGLLRAEDMVRRGTGLKFRRGGAGLSGRLTSFAIRMASGDLEGAIGFRKTRGFPYELSQEFGAKASGGKAMSIPLSGAAKAASNRGIGPRQSGIDLNMIKIGSRMFLVEHRKTRSEFHYILVKSIPPRLRFRQTVYAALPMISDEVVRGASRETGAS